MSEANQAAYATWTEQDAHILNTTGTVHWEWTSTWDAAINNYFPKFAKHGIVRGFFAVNVPYFVPTTFTWPGEHYKILSGGGVLFTPNEWRGNQTSEIHNLDHHNLLQPKALAEKINGYEGGTVTHIYTTSDGGFRLSMLDEMVSYLGEHVCIVPTDELVQRAVERG